MVIEPVSVKRSKDYLYCVDDRHRDLTCSQTTKDVSCNLEETHWKCCCNDISGGISNAMGRTKQGTTIAAADLL
jgi:hypothetical protein